LFWLTSKLGPFTKEVAYTIARVRGVENWNRYPFVAAKGSLKPSNQNVLYDEGLLTRPMLT